MVAIVYTASAHMPSRCKGHYRRVMVLDVSYWLAAQHQLGKWAPRACNSKEVHRIIRDYGSQSVGKTERCAYQVALKQARETAILINSAGDVASAEQIIGAGGSA